MEDNEASVGALARAARRWLSRIESGVSRARPHRGRLSGAAPENNSTGHYAQSTSDISIQESWLHIENDRMSHKHTSLSTLL